MDISELTVRLVLLFFPGIICALIVDALSTHRKWDAFTFAMHSFLLGISTYLGLYMLRVLWVWGSKLTCGSTKWTLTFFESLTDKAVPINWKEIIAATITAVLLGVLLSYLAQKKVVHKIAQKLGITKKFGEMDVWELVLNSPDTEWVVVRDLGADLAYEGQVRAFSDTVQEAELLLHDVKVYSNTTGKYLYWVGGMYLSRDKANTTIELMELGYEAAASQEEVTQDGKEGNTQPADPE